jgi:hypothetical protein
LGTRRFRCGSDQTRGHHEDLGIAAIALVLRSRSRPDTSSFSRTRTASLRTRTMAFHLYFSPTECRREDAFRTILFLTQVFELQWYIRHGAHAMQRWTGPRRCYCRQVFRTGCPKGIWCISVNPQGTGDAQFPPLLMLSLLIYNYAVGACVHPAVHPTARPAAAEAEIQQFSGCRHNPRVTVAGMNLSMW